jgi:hypothetical protein
MPLAAAFVSNDVAVKLINDDVLPSRDLGAIDVKSIDVVKLGQLYAMLTGKSFLEILPEFPEIHALSDDGPWIYRCPAALRSRLTQLDAASISATAARWAKVSDFSLATVEVATVESMLRGLADLARRAELDGDNLYLWNCL